MVAKTLLGISPGTRIFGLAVLKHGELVEWKVKTFKEKWSKEKEKAILSMIEKLCMYYQVHTISIKKLNPLHSSVQLDLLYDAILRLAARVGVKIASYSLSDLDYEERDGRRTKEVLSAHVAGRHPVLKQAYQQERNNRKEYYTKMFEAIAIAEACRDW